MERGQRNWLCPTSQTSIVFPPRMSVEPSGGEAIGRRSRISVGDDAGASRHVHAADHAVGFERRHGARIRQQQRAAEDRARVEIGEAGRGRDGPAQRERRQCRAVRLPEAECSEVRSFASDENPARGHDRCREPEMAPLTKPMPISVAPLPIDRPALSVIEPPSSLIVPLVMPSAALIVRSPVAPISSVWFASLIEIAAVAVAMPLIRRSEATVGSIARTDPLSIRC